MFGKSLPSCWRLEEGLFRVAQFKLTFSEHMKIALHGFGSFPVVFWHIIQHAKTCANPPEWGIILTSDHHQQRFEALLGPERVAVLTQGPGKPRPGEENWVYPGAFYRDLASEKRNYMSVASAAQRERGLEMYRQTRRFMEKFRPTHAFVSQTEGFDGKAFIAAAKEFGAEVVVPIHCRNLDGTYFASDDLSTHPNYAFRGWEKHKSQAEEFIAQFRKNPLPAWNPAMCDDEVLEDYTPSFPTRAAQAIRRWCFTPHGFQRDFLKTSLINNLPAVRDGIWAIRRFLNQRFCNVTSLEQLPNKFIYYPLQFTPEASINTPAPYFTDQLRAIDAICFAMPSDCQLVVKEHPSCIRMRSSRFVRQLMRKAGVIVAHYNMPSTEIQKRAGLTMSVTGTSTFEAMLQGGQAITLGPNLVSVFLGGIPHLEDLPARVSQVFGKPYPIEDAVRAVAILINANYPIFFSCPGIAGEPVLRKGNITRIYEAFLDHCRRLDADKHDTPTS